LQNPIPLAIAIHEPAIFVWEDERLQFPGRPFILLWTSAFHAALQTVVRCGSNCGSSGDRNAKSGASHVTPLSRS
jgi:hypothetical protein